jgi:hypothetical protein
MPRSRHWEDRREARRTGARRQRLRRGSRTKWKRRLPARRAIGAPPLCVDVSNAHTFRRLLFLGHRRCAVFALFRLRSPAFRPSPSSLPRKDSFRGQAAIGTVQDARLSLHFRGPVLASPQTPDPVARRSHPQLTLEEQCSPEELARPRDPTLSSLRVYLYVVGHFAVGWGATQALRFARAPPRGALCFAERLDRALKAQRNVTTYPAAKARPPG